MHILAISPGKDIETSRWEAVALSGVDALMIREKHMNAKSLLGLGLLLRGLAPNLPLWVSDRLDVAIALGAGLHGGDGYPPIPDSLCPVSRPLHAITQIGERRISDQLLISPVFTVPNKGIPLQVMGLHDILDNIPPWQGKLLALGGINPNNAATLKHPRLYGVALIRGIWDSDDPRSIVDNLRNAWG
jgi:thiamine monophosphate synthase